MPSQESDPAERIDTGNKILFYIPFVRHPVTQNEIHAALIGCVGFLLGSLYTQGMHKLITIVVLALAGYAILGKVIFEILGYGSSDTKKSIGMRTIRHEPWWFLATFISSFILTLTHIGPLI